MTITMERPTKTAGDSDGQPCRLAWCTSGEAAHTNHGGHDESADFSAERYDPAEDGYLTSLMVMLERRDHAHGFGPGPTLLNVMASNDHTYWAGYMTPGQAERFARSLLLQVALAYGVDVDGCETVAEETIRRFRLLASAVKA